MIAVFDPDFAAEHPIAIGGISQDHWHQHNGSKQENLTVRFKTNRHESIPCQIAANAPDVGDHEPCQGAFDGFLEILGEAAAYRARQPVIKHGCWRTLTGTAAIKHE